MRSTLKKVALIFSLIFMSCNNSGMRIRSADIRDYFSDERVVALCAAAATGNVKEIERSLSKDVDINAMGKDGMTPLLWALGSKNKTGIRYLLEHGANPNLQDPDGDSAISLVASAEDSEYLKMVLEFGGNPNLISTAVTSSPTPIFRAINTMNVENVKILIDAGADINFQANHLYTPMIAAASLNQWNIVYLLLEAGADYSLRDSWGYTIVYNIENNVIDPQRDGYQWRQKVIAFLRQRGVAVNPKTP